MDLKDIGGQLNTNLSQEHLERNYIETTVTRKRDRTNQNSHESIETIR